jgi:TolB protein
MPGSFDPTAHRRRKYLVALTTTMLLAAAGINLVTSPADASPPRNGQIALASDRNGVAHIYLVSPTGETSQLTTGDLPDSMPNWSPDGQEVAFVRTVSPSEADIWVVDADGRNPRRLTSGAEDSAPLWSPDGTMLAFRRKGGGDRDGSIMVMGADGQHPLNVSPGGLNYDPSWAPDSAYLLFTHFEGVITSQCSNGQCPSDNEVYRVGADGTGLTNLTNKHTADDGSARVSPDGRTIAFASTRAADHYFEIYTMDVDGSHVQQRNGTGGKGIDVGPVWSPDSTRLLFMRGSVSSAGAYELYSMNADGSDSKKLTDNKTYDGQPSWSPDGTKILFDRYVDGGYRWFTMNADGTQEAPVGDSHDLEFGADWQPVVNAAPSAPGVPTGPTLSNTGAFSLHWSAATDPDADDSVVHTLLAHDGSTSAWTTVATGLTDPSYTFDSAHALAEGTWHFEVTATDPHGATGPASPVSAPVVVDKSAPASPDLTVAPGQSPVTVDGVDWFRDDVLVDVAPGADPLLADGTPGSGVDPASYPVSVTLSANGTQSLIESDTDRAGNVSAASTPLVVHVDALAPTLDLDCPGQVELNGDAHATVSAADHESGLDQDPTGAYPVDTSTPGFHTLTFRAGDRVGHVTERTCAIDVVYHFGGFAGALAHRADHPSNGRSVPFTVTLTDASGSPVTDARPTVDIAPVEDGVVGPYAPATSRGAQSQDVMTFQPDGYHYVLDTSGLAAGTYSIRVSPGDGSTHATTLVLKRR